MRLRKIHIKGFIIYSDAYLEFPDSKLSNVYGIDKDRNISIGIGKSALKEAVLFALYGKTNVNLSDLIKKGEDKCTVALDFEVGDHYIELIRSYKNTSTLDIKVDGKNVLYSTVREKQSYLEELIGLDYNGCVNFSIFDAVRFEDLSSLSSSEIIRLLQLLFNYNKFNKTLENLKDSHRQKDNLLTQLQNRKTHYFSEKRLQTLHLKIERLSSYLSIEQTKIGVLNNLRRTLSNKQASNITIIDKNKRLVGWIMSKTQCPTCSKPLDNKVQILNSFQSEINQSANDNFLLSNRLKKVDNALQVKSEIVQQINSSIVKANVWLSKLRGAQQETLDITNIEKERDKYKKAIEVLKKFELYVMEHYINYLEKIINEYLEPLIDIRCKLSFLNQGVVTTRSVDKFYMKLYRHESFQNKFTKDFVLKEHEYNFTSLSSGERMLVSYAFKLAINALNFKDTFLFIDEGLSRLDISDRNKLIQLLQFSPFNQIFVISHDGQIPDIPTIFITKENNASTISLVASI